MPAPLRIAAITFRKFSQVEYILPLLAEIRRRDPQAEINYFFCGGPESVVFNKETFFRKYLEKLRVKCEDTDSLKTVKRSWYDSAFFSKVRSWVNTRRGIDLHGFDQKLARKVHHVHYAQSVRDRLASQLRDRKKFLKKHRIEIQNFIIRLRQVRPDIIVLDHKSALYTWPALAAFLEYVNSHHVRVIVPPETCFRGFLYNFADALPKSLRAKFEYWFPYAESGLFPEKTAGRADCHYLGAPPLDGNWIDSLKTQLPTKSDRPLRCAYVIRKFMAPGASERKKQIGDITYELFLEQTRTVLRTLEKVGDFHLIIKPYPSMDPSLVVQACQDLKFDRFTIIYDCTYAYLGEVDLVITEFTTASFPFVAAKVPVLLLGHSVYAELLDEDPVYMTPIQDIFPLHTEAHKDFSLSMEEQLELFLNKNAMAEKMAESQRAFRCFYPVESCARHWDRIQRIISELRRRRFKLWGFWSR